MSLSCPHGIDFSAPFSASWRCLAARLASSHIPILWVQSRLGNGPTIARAGPGRPWFPRQAHPSPEDPSTTVNENPFRHLGELPNSVSLSCSSARSRSHPDYLELRPLSQNGSRLSLVAGWRPVIEGLDGSLACSTTRQCLTHASNISELNLLERTRRALLNLSTI